MKLVTFYYSILLFSSFVFCQSNEVAVYERALKEVLNTEEYKSLNEYGKSFYVSDEILYYDLFSRFFKEELSQESVYDVYASEIVNKKKEMLKLNKKKCSKIKIFFSEIKGEYFFTEVFVAKKKKLKYSERSIFGSSYVFLFKIENGNTILVKVNEFHYN